MRPDTPCTIRLAVPDDVPGIFRVRTAVQENRLSMAELAELGITPQAVTAMLQDSTCAWVASEAGHILGFSMIDQHEGALFAAFVLPTHEGRGIGRALVEVAEAALFAMHERVWLETAASSRAAGFYRRLGWDEQTDVGEGDIRLEKCRPSPP